MNKKSKIVLSVVFVLMFLNFSIMPVKWLVNLAFFEEGNFDVDFHVESSEKVLVQTVKDIHAVTENSYDSKYIGNIYYQEIEELEEESVNLKTGANIFMGKILGKYFYPTRTGVMVQGVLLGTEHTNYARLKKMVAEVKQEIESEAQNEEASEYISTAMQIGNAWELNTLQKYVYSMDYDGVHYGEFTEWTSCYTIETKMTDLSREQEQEQAERSYRYHLIAHESYITPNNSANSDLFRPSHLIYDFSVNDNDERAHIRDYQPRSRGESEKGTIAYGNNFTTEMGLYAKDKDLSAKVSVCYEACEGSPMIFDRGNMAHDRVYLDFDYKVPDSGEEPYYSYNTHSTMQTSICVVREEIKDGEEGGAVTAKDRRTVQLVKSNLLPWLQEEVSFRYDIIYTL